MKILVIRHAIAESREDFHQKTGVDDAHRPLTPIGIEKWQIGAQGLIKKGLAPNEIWSSPYERARHTAKILAELLKKKVLYSEELIPEQSVDSLLTRVLDAYQEDENYILALVGHETHLSQFIELCVPDKYDANKQSLKKGGACFIDIQHKDKKFKFKLLDIYKARDLREFAA